MSNTIIFFDTETTGLLPKIKNMNRLNVNEYPHIVQISWIIYDLDLKKIIKTADYIIKCPIHIMNSNIHGVTDEISQEKGVEIGKVIGEFFVDMYECDLNVAHNHAFDKKVIHAEMLRLDRLKEFDLFSEKLSYCTMMETKNFCQLDGMYGNFKWPKLQELHLKLFGEEFKGCHNSLCDVTATLNCYLKFVHRIDRVFYFNKY